MKKFLACAFLFLVIQAAWFVPMGICTANAKASWNNMIHRNWSIVTVAPTGKALTDVHENISEEVAYTFKGTPKTQYIEEYDPSKSLIVDTNPIQLYMDVHTGVVMNQGWSPQNNLSGPELAPALLCFVGIVVFAGGLCFAIEIGKSWNEIFAPRPQKVKEKLTKSERQLYEAHRQDAIKAFAYEAAKRELEAL